MKRLYCLLFLLTWLSTSSAQNSTNPTDVEEKKEAKAFSIFSVVQFNNLGCRSQSAMSSGQSTVRNGTCFTATECTTKGGTASGNCASGFGVCCIFLVSSTSTTISQNCTYLRNPSFPSAYSGTTSLSYSVTKSNSDVCWLRLDFETFTILGPSTTSEPSDTCPDKFTMTTTSVPSSLIPTICGSNAGQHVYIEMGNAATDTATLGFTFSGTSTTRTWEIKVSQINCYDLNRPPSGCLQYYTTLVGRIMSFNFKSTTSSHLNSVDQTACIRQAQGYCCVEYQLCTDQTNAFTLDRVTDYETTVNGLVDTGCAKDYVAIPGSTSGQCNNRISSQFSRYCGFYLGLTILGVAHQPICDCTAPFIINIHSDSTTDGNSIQPIPNRGLCLDFTQVPCN